jgi:hypothetical protein
MLVARFSLEQFYAPGRICPRCWKRHRSWYAVARCRWKRHLWVSGNPPVNRDAYATISDCGRVYPPTLSLRTIVLHPTREKAEAALDLINRVSCGGACSRQHRLIHLPVSERDQP